MLVQHTIELPGGTMSYLSNDESVTSNVIIALHGWLDNASSFVPLQESFTEARWIIPDLPGHGQSYHRPLGSYYHFIDWVEDIVDFIEALELPHPPTIVGHSMGGMISQLIAGIYPEKVRRLVLLDAAGLITQKQGSVVADMREAFDSRRKLKDKSKRVHQQLESAIKARMSTGSIGYEAAKLLTLRNINKVEGGFEWKTDVRLRTGSPLRVSDSAAREIISKIKAPTLILLADKGYLMMKDNYTRFADFYEDHECVEVSGHHHCHMENPTAVAEQLCKFLL